MAHGDMLSPQIATPSTAPSSVKRKRPSVTVRGADTEADIRLNKDTKEKQASDAMKEELEKLREQKRKSKPKVRLGVQGATPADDSSDEDFAPDPASPTSNKRRRTDPTAKVDGANDPPSPFLKAAEKNGCPTELSLDDPKTPAKALKDMTVQELLVHDGVDTPENPYKEHLLGRHEPFVYNPTIKIPAVVKRGFKPRPTAEQIQKNIQGKVREKLGLPPPPTDGSSSSR